MNLQVYDDSLHIYYNRKLVTIHPLSQKKLNYQDNHYIEISKLTLKNDLCRIQEIAKNNLKLIGAVYKNE